MSDSLGIGPFLRDHRERTGWSLGALSRVAGVSKSALSTWERGLRQPCLPELDAVLTALKTPREARDQALALIDAPRARRALQNTAAANFRPELMVALRSRIGLDQAELAALLGVRQSSVSRWERGENEPSIELLTRFAALSGASESEWTTLTRPAPYGNGTSLEELEVRFFHIAFDAPMPRDIEYLLLRRALAKVDCEEGRRLRARVAIRHAQCLAECGRVREAVSAALDANALAWKEGLSREALVPLAIAEASITRSADRALRTLATLGDVRDPVLRAWIADERGYHLLRAGLRKEAVASSREGVEIARAEGRPVERYFRARGAGRVLVRVGLLDEAQRLLQVPRPEGVIATALDHIVPMDLSRALRDEAGAMFHREQATLLAGQEGRLLKFDATDDEPFCLAV